jgi:two-component system, OmpR family, response regulator
VKLLIVEDNDYIGTHILRELNQRGHATEMVGSAEAGLASLASGNFDAVVLDRMLPGIDGIEMLQRMRMQRNDAPVLMLSALGALDDRIDGLQAGADDYMVKPFSADELEARLHAIYRRAQQNLPEEKLRVGQLVLDLATHRAKHGEQILYLNKKEFGLLAQLVRNVDQVTTRRMLIEAVWGYSFDPDTNIVESNMSRLRSKLRLDAGIDPVETVRSEGYILRSDYLCR